MTPDTPAASAGRLVPWVVVAAGAAVFVLSAVALEALGGSGANSPLPAWADLVPLAWPPAARVAWWTSVAAMAGLFRLALHRLGLPQRPLVVAASVVPFLAFAVGIALGVDWATWH